MDRGTKGRVAVGMLALLLTAAGCAPFAVGHGGNPPAVIASPQDAALRSVAGLEITLTASYNTLADLVEAQRITQDQGRAIRGNLNEAATYLMSARQALLNSPANVTGANAFLELATQLLQAASMQLTMHGGRVQ